MSDVELHQFPSSHFNEKARWALDFKGIEHKRIPHLPGPHALAIRRLSGQTATPVLDLNSKVIAGSAQIIAELERFKPEPALYPEDPVLRERALEIQRWFDSEIGPQVRCAVFSVLLEDLGYLHATFAYPHGALKRTIYRAMLPLVKPVIAKANGVTGPAAVDAAFAGTTRGFDFVAAESAQTGYLVGDRFSIADLTAASLLAPAILAPHPDMAKREPVPAEISAFVARWKDHPGAQWVHQQYRTHRPDPATR
ncbi:MAG: glutathione S-transferase family protein [bacterium]|nr:glutathione S-transferase family protein [bacterium]